jgi:hypothetical protein
MVGKQQRALVNTAMNLRFPQHREFVSYLSEYQLLKMGSVLQVSSGACTVCIALKKTVGLLPTYFQGGTEETNKNRHSR